MNKIATQRRALPIVLWTLATFCAAGALRAIEIPLESFGKGTKIAYVNMHKIFESYPETEKARVQLNEMIEEKKSEISAKKEEIARLKAQVEFLRKQNASVDLSQPRPAPPSPPKEEIDSPIKETGPESMTPLTLPENSPLEFLFSPPKDSTAPPEMPAATDPNAVRISTHGPQVLPGVPSPKPQLEEKEAELSRKQADLEAFIGASELDVKNMEEGKTMTVLAKIYSTLEEIAAKEGYTIIVDKANILYGEGTVDITENVLWRLSSPKGRFEEQR